MMQHGYQIEQRPEIIYYLDHLLSCEAILASIVQCKGHYII